MPGPIVHLIVQQRMAQGIRHADDSPKGLFFSQLLEEDLCSPYAGFGSMGPDFLFFSVKEYGDGLATLVNAIFDVYNAMKPFIDFYKEHVEPVQKEIDKITTFIDQTFFEGLFGQLKAVTGTMKDTLLLAAGNLLTNTIDPFYLFFPKLQAGAPETDWYWFDFLHYRRTGDFCTKLWEMAGASGDKDLMRYALGYASHIGTDVVGHPFVNAIVGGPYRMHWRRHKLVENWIDAYARNRYKDLPAIKGCLNLEAEDLYSDKDISGSYWYRLVAFEDGKLPDKLSNLFADAMKSTYTGIPKGHPPFFSAADVDSTYRLWLMWFKRATSVGSARKPVPVPPPGSAAVKLIKEFLEFLDSFPSPPGLGGSGGGSFSLKNLFKKIKEWADWIGDVIDHVTDWVVKHIEEIIKLPITEALALLKWLLYQIHKLIYELYDELRFGLALAGLLFPESGDLTRSMNGSALWSDAFINTKFVQTTGGGVAKFSQYPLRRKDHGLTGPLEHHLTYPTTLRERWYAEPMPQVYYNVYPEQFIELGFMSDPAILDLYAAVMPYGSAPQATHPIDEATWTTAQFGSAIEFTGRLIATRIQKLPNFNLDGDRGYGWKTWEADDPGKLEAPDRKDLIDPNFPPVETTYLDP